MATDLWAMAEHCSSPRVLELHEGERRSPSSIFQINVSNRSVFVEQVFNVLWANIRREVPHVDTTVIVSRGSSKPTAWHGHAVVPEVSELACNTLYKLNFKKKNALPELRAILSLIYYTALQQNYRCLNPRTRFGATTTGPNKPRSTTMRRAAFLLLDVAVYGLSLALPLFILHLEEWNTATWRFGVFRVAPYRGS